MTGTEVMKYGAVIGSLDAIVIVVLEDDDSKTTVALTSELSTTSPDLLTCH